MKRFLNFKLVVLLFILAIAFVFVGYNFVQAEDGKGKGKKPPKVEEIWSVTIPNESGTNLFAHNDNDDSHTLTGNDFVSVGFSPPSEQCPCYGFHLRINRPLTQGFSPFRINFQDLMVDNLLKQHEEGIPCVLPGLDQDDCLGEATCVPDCIVDFLNYIPHPSNGYVSASIWVQLGAEFIDNLGEGVYTPLPPNCGFIYFSMYNGDPVIPEDSTGIYHGVFGFTDIVGLVITKQLNGDRWIMEFSGQPLEFKEHYTEEYTYFRGKKEKKGTRWITPFEIVTWPTTFKMIWEKVQ